MHGIHGIKMMFLCFFWPLQASAVQIQSNSVFTYFEQLTVSLNKMLSSSGCDLLHDCFSEHLTTNKNVKNVFLVPSSLPCQSLAIPRYMTSMLVNNLQDCRLLRCRSRHYSYIRFSHKCNPPRVLWVLPRRS
jgi:hypothetical protein